MMIFQTPQECCDILHEVRALHEVARPPAWLPDSARRGLTGAMLTFFRVAGRLGTR